MRLITSRFTPCFCRCIIWLCNEHL